MQGCTLLALVLALPPAPLKVQETAPMARAAVPALALKPTTLNELFAAAIEDAKKLPPEIAKRTRYFDARTLVGEKADENYAVVSYQVNAISREFARVKPRRVQSWLWAICLDDYRWDAGVWENLAKHDAYYHVPVQIKNVPVVETKPAPVEKPATQRVLQPNGTYAEVPITPAVPVKTPEPEKPKAVEKVNDYLPAPWISPKLSAELGTMLNTKMPIIRADQFVILTGIQVDRKGVGYYDWFGFTKRADVEKLVKLNRRDSEDVYKEVAAIVPFSQIALNNRQVFRLQALTGGWWETRDTKTSKDKQNAQNNLLDDFKHDAEEIVFTLPNGLPGFYLSEADGKQVDSAPDFIAADHRSTNNDKRVHVGMSCITCHADGGLKPIRDYARKIYNENTGISLGTLALDPAKARRLRSVYLGPLEKSYTRDLGDFAESITDVTGLKPQVFAKAYEVFWSRYQDDPVTLERAAVETGYTAETIQAKLREQAVAKRLVNPVLAVYLMDEPIPVRREHFEEHFGLLMLTLSGGNP